ncbi:MAG: hypothetical protein KKG47_04600 [Proteobacteria bacterium]|nr:hypothetical protein [Pseudomonadota bacterium]MBU1738801.1 hypothetical protein [Pseudomonadota bacterium]
MKLSDKGFSIIEILMGVSVFALGLMGVLALLMSSVNSNAFSSRLSEATFLANSKLEDLMSQNYDTAAVAGGDLADTDGDAAGGSPFGLFDFMPATADWNDPPQGRNTAFTVLWNNAPGQPGPNSTTTRVVVTWSEKGVQRRIGVTGVIKDED